eukprot:TRINITY_DN1484_c0_g1_i7.p1 TRINITY_DN1484_c0_g1~~TRINITY_DN1484_c0_g1_i7.p1  ORF type:complete len:348 (-),score=-42.80 TRINITY_DN1484_c0_g1_i7:30-1073(-)
MTNPITPYVNLTKHQMNFMICSGIGISLLCLQKAVRKYIETKNEEETDVTWLRITYWGTIIFNTLKNIPSQYLGFCDHQYETRRVRNVMNYLQLSAGSWWLIPQVSLINLILATIDKASTNGNINNFTSFDFLINYIPVFMGALYWLFWGIFIFFDQSNNYSIEKISQKSIWKLSKIFGQARNIKYEYFGRNYNNLVELQELSNAIFALFGIGLFITNAYLIHFLINLADGKIPKYRLDVLRRDFKWFGITNIVISLLSLIQSGNFVVRFIVNKIKGKNYFQNNIFKFDKKWTAVNYVKGKDLDKLDCTIINGEELFQFILNILFLLNFTFNAPGRHRNRKRKELSN